MKTEALTWLFPETCLWAHATHYECLLLDEKFFELEGQG